MFFFRLFIDYILQKMCKSVFRGEGISSNSLFWDHVLNGESSFQTLLHVDKKGDAINDLLHQFNLMKRNEN